MSYYHTFHSCNTSKIALRKRCGLQVTSYFLILQCTGYNKQATDLTSSSQLSAFRIKGENMQIEIEIKCAFWAAGCSMH